MLSVNVKFEITLPVKASVVNRPVVAVVAPIEVLLIVPPVIAAADVRPRFKLIKLVSNSVLVSGLPFTVALPPEVSLVVIAAMLDLCPILYSIFIDLTGCR